MPFYLYGTKNLITAFLSIENFIFHIVYELLSTPYVVSALRKYLEIRPKTDLLFLFINKFGEQISPQSVRLFIIDIGKKFKQT